MLLAKARLDLKKAKKVFLGLAATLLLMLRSKHILKILFPMGEWVVGWGLTSKSAQLN